MTILSCILLATVLRAYFDSHNVTVGDPMELSVEVANDPTFELEPQDGWKIYPGTHYRVRPLKAGLRYFRAGPYNLPVHVREGQGVDINLEETDTTKFPDWPELNDFDLNRAFFAGNYTNAWSQLAARAWQEGQTPELESAMLAVRTRMLGNPYAELPAWRLIARPLLKYPLKRQVAIVGVSLLVIIVGLLLIGKGVNRFAAVAIVTLSFSKPELTVGDPFDFIINYSNASNIQVSAVTPSNMMGLSYTGKPIVKNGQIIVPARFDVPIKDDNFTVRLDGLVTEKQEINQVGFHFVSTSSQSFSEFSSPIHLEVKPLSAADQPPEFSGIIADNLRVMELPDMLNCETNDVITIQYRLSGAMYVPENFVPPHAMYRWNENEYRGYLVADGKTRTPEVSICYYSPKLKTYKWAKSPGSEIRYHE